MDVSILAPLFSCPVNSDLNRCQSSCSDWPDSSELRDASTPLQPRWLMEKNPVTGAYRSPAE